MQDEYDFSSAERGKFYRSETALQLSIYLAPDVREYLAVRARAKGIEINQLVNEMLRESMRADRGGETGGESS
jgi:predicted HicB family RNase H-like nuclease